MCSSDLEFETALVAGKYRIRITNYEFEDVEKIIQVDPLKSELIDIEQTKLPTAKLRLKVQGVPGESWVIVDQTPLGVLTTSEGSLELELPRGNHMIRVVSRGFRETSFQVEVHANIQREVRLEAAQPVLLVNDDPQQEFTDYYTNSLTELEIAHTLSAANEVNLASLLTYDTVIWFTGNGEENTLNDLEIEALETYLELGGQLLLSGHGVAKDLENNQFLLRVLGAKFKSQRWLFRNIKLDELKLKLNGKDSADNQSRPDVLEPFLAEAQTILKYSLIGGAGVSHTFGAGKSILLGFGLEGVRGADKRAQAMQKLLEILKLTPEEKLANLERFYLKNPPLHDLITSLYARSSPKDSKTLRSLLEKKTNTSPFRKLLFKLQNR